MKKKSRRRKRSLKKKLQKKENCECAALLNFRFACELHQGFSVRIYPEKNQEKKQVCFAPSLCHLHLWELFLSFISLVKFVIMHLRSVRLNRLIGARQVILEIQFNLSCRFYAKRKFDIVISLYCYFVQRWSTHKDITASFHDKSEKTFDVLLLVLKCKKPLFSSQDFDQ